MAADLTFAGDEFVVEAGALVSLRFDTNPPQRRIFAPLAPRSIDFEPMRPVG
jgi:hypothetical protein